MKPVTDAGLAGDGGTSALPGAPFLGLFATFPDSVQEALIELCGCFESVDAVILEEFNEPHLAARHTTSDFVEFEYDKEEAAVFATLVTEHAHDAILAYLGNTDYARYWQRVLNALSRTLSWVSMFQGNGVAIFRIRRMERITEDLPRLYATARVGNVLPTYVTQGIKTRIGLLETFLDNCEEIIHMKDLGSRDLNTMNRELVGLSNTEVLI